MALDLRLCEDSISTEKRKGVSHEEDRLYRGRGVRGACHHPRRRQVRAPPRAPGPRLARVDLLARGQPPQQRAKRRRKHLLEERPYDHGKHHLAGEVLPRDDRAGGDVAHAAEVGHRHLLLARAAREARGEKPERVARGGERAHEGGHRSQLRREAAHVGGHARRVGEDHQNERDLGRRGYDRRELTRRPPMREVVRRGAKKRRERDGDDHLPHHPRRVDLDRLAEKHVQREGYRERRGHRGDEDRGQAERRVSPEHVDPHGRDHGDGHAVLEHEPAHEVGARPEERRAERAGERRHEHGRNGERDEHRRGMADGPTEVGKRVGERALERHERKERRDRGLEQRELVGKQHAEHHARRRDEGHVATYEAPEPAPRVHVTSPLAAQAPS